LSHVARADHSQELVERVNTVASKIEQYAREMDTETVRRLIDKVDDLERELLRYDCLELEGAWDNRSSAIGTQV
jgi:hypothetical protein